MEFLDFAKKDNGTDIETIIKKVRSNELKDGQAVKVRGMLHRVREMSGFAFVLVRSARMVFQCVWEENVSNVDIKSLNPEDSVIIDGFLSFDERSRIGFDIKIDTVTKLGGGVEQSPIEISNDRKIAKLQLNTLLDNRVLTVRNPRVRAVLRVCDGVEHAFRTFLRSENFVEFIPPKIVQAGAEGGADMFEIDYFGEKAYLNQSPQMYKQIMVAAFERVYAIAPVFRGEKHNTNRHINEFQGLDLEMGFIDSFHDLMALEARLFVYMAQCLNDEYAAELEIVLGKGAKLPVPDKFPTIKFADAKQLYAEKRKTTVTDPADLDPDEEKWLGQYFMEQYNAPLVFITHYPSKKRPFYAMDDPADDRYTLSFDALLHGLEITTGGQRINDYNEQVEKMRRRGMNTDDFADYLAMHKYGIPPHGGFGMGLERIVQKLLNLENIREVTAFPRDRERLRP